MTEDYISREEFKQLEAKSERAVNNTHFYWIVGGISSAIIVGFFYLLNRIDNISLHQSDHDKLIQLETEMNHIKKH